MVTARRSMWTAPRSEQTRVESLQTGRRSDPSVTTPRDEHDHRANQGATKDLSLRSARSKVATALQPASRACSRMR
jgi:hypothetical protein